MDLLAALKHAQSPPNVLLHAGLKIGQHRRPCVVLESGEDNEEIKKNK